MRTLMHVKFPHREFNDAMRKGDVGKKMHDILEDAKPEAVYFTEYDGRRGVFMVIDITDASQVPKFAEPWFLSFGADVEFRVAMTPEDLGRGGLEDLAKKWL
jgi:hypothetical protein